MLFFADCKWNDDLRDAAVNLSGKGWKAAAAVGVNCTVKCN